MTRNAVVVVVVALFFGGCISSERFVEVRLASAADVDVAAPPTAKVERNKTDVVVDGKSVLADGSWSARRAPAVVRRVTDAPAELRVRDRYAWKRGDVTATTPAHNVTGADVGTMWTQPFGIVPSLGATVAGGACALGFGLAGGDSLAKAAAGDDKELGQGIGLTLAAVGGAALATYGVVTWVLVSGSPYYDEVPVVRER
jgi:hypothetical protein